MDTTRIDDINRLIAEKQEILKMDLSLLHEDTLFDLSQIDEIRKELMNG